MGFVRLNSAVILTACGNSMFNRYILFVPVAFLSMHNSKKYS